MIILHIKSWPNCSSSWEPASIYHENSLYLAFMHIKTRLSSLFILYRFLILHFTNFRHLCVKVFSLLWNSWINDYISIGNLDFQGLIPLYYTANVVNKLPFHYKYHYPNSMYIYRKSFTKKKILHVFDGTVAREKSGFNSGNFLSTLSK